MNLEKRMLHVSAVECIRRSSSNRISARVGPGRLQATPRSLSHPTIARGKEMGVHNNAGWIAMERFDGVTLTTAVTAPRTGLCRPSQGFP